MSLKMDGVTASYEKNEVLHDVSIEAKLSAITCIIGPNGSGKSTLLKTVMGFLRPRRGSITFGGEDISGLRPDLVLKKGISMVPQERSIFPQMCVKENIYLGAYTVRSRDQVKERAAEVFKLFPILEQRMSQLAGSLSGGEQRMLEIGRALMQNPKLLLLDEPSAMLSPGYVEMIFQKIKEINRKGVGVVVVEQNVRKALETADYVYVLDLGRNIFDGVSNALLGDAGLIKLYLGE